MHIEIPKLRERQRREREELVVQGAERLIVEGGYTNLVMDRVAERVGVATGTLYQIFPTKKDLFAAVVVRRMGRFTAQLVATCQCSDLSTPGRLVLVSQSLLEEQSTWTRIMRGVETAELEQVLMRRAELGDGFQRIVRSVAQVIEEAQQAGDFEAEISPVAAAVALIGLIQAHARLSPLLPSALRPTPFQLFDVLFIGLLPPLATRRVAPG